MTIEKLFPTDVLWNEDREIFDDISWNNDYDIEEAKVYRVIWKSKKKSIDKAPAKDGIKFKYVKCIPEVFLKRITSCFNACIRKGKFLNC